MNAGVTAERVYHEVRSRILANRLYLRPGPAASPADVDNPDRRG